MESKELELRYQVIKGQTFPTVGFVDSPLSLDVAVFGEIIPWSFNNNNPERGRKAQEWRVKIAETITKTIKENQGKIPWDDGNEYTVSIAMFFNRSGRNQKLDVDNHIKPILDAVAAGLFSKDLDLFLRDSKEALHEFPKTGKMPSFRAKWNFDDSRFKTVFAHRLPDHAPLLPNGTVWDQEGIAIRISSLDQPKVNPEPLPPQSRAPRTSRAGRNRRTSTTNPNQLKLPGM